MQDESQRNEEKKMERNKIRKKCGRKKKHEYFNASHNLRMIRLRFAFISRFYFPIYSYLFICIFIFINSHEFGRFYEMKSNFMHIIRRSIHEKTHVLIDKNVARFVSKWSLYFKQIDKESFYWIRSPAELKFHLNWL